MEKIISSLIQKGYIVSFQSAKDNNITISVMPINTGLGTSVTIDKNANYADALKAIQFNLLY